MPKYRKKPIEIEAEQFTEERDSLVKISALMHNSGQALIINDKSLGIDTLEGLMTASLGDFIIKEIKGEIYPCKPDIFEKTYEKVD